MYYLRVTRVPSKSVVRSTFSLPTLLGLLFMTLKLCGVIDWSWLWVLAPFWIPIVIGILFLAIFVAVILLAGALSALSSRR